MPKIRRHKPGRYKEKSQKEPDSNFTGVKPLSVFQSENGKWGAKDGNGEIIIEALYDKAEQTQKEKDENMIRLVYPTEVIMVTPEDWDVIFWIDEEFLYNLKDKGTCPIRNKF